MKRNRSARTIKAVLRDINRNKFDDYSIEQLREHLAHIKILWKNFARRNEKLAEHAESANEQKKRKETRTGRAESSKWNLMTIHPKTITKKKKFSVRK